jgi:HAD superfamily hydrolase (TIGR01509 family)
MRLELQTFMDNLVQPGHMLKAVIFDLDGTLTDSDKVHFQVFQEFFSQHGIALDRAMYRQKISGRQNAAILADFLPHLSASEKEAFSASKEETFRFLAEGQLDPLPGLLSLLSRLKKQGLAVAVVTNAPSENAAFMLSELWLTEAFSPIVIGDELARGKPDPLPYQTALDKLGILAEEAIAFEDSTAGICSATGAGIKTIGMTTTHDSETLLAAGAAQAIADFTDPYIQTLFPA